MSQIDNKARSGICGLDDVLEGGFSRGHVFLLEGEPLQAFQGVLRGVAAYEGDKGAVLAGKRA
jgi:KaiC/GvpD/RAD55 family RecA-like ATPase